MKVLFFSEQISIKKMSFLFVQGFCRQIAVSKTFSQNRQDFFCAYVCRQVETVERLKIVQTFFQLFEPSTHETVKNLISSSTQPLKISY